jgi:hypothetical protein
MGAPEVDKNCCGSILADGEIPQAGRPVLAQMFALRSCLEKSAAAEEKQPNGPGPKGCDENGPAAALLVGHVSVQICSLHPPVRLGPPYRRPILNKIPRISGTGH